MGASGEKRTARPRRKTDRATVELLKILLSRLDNIEGRLAGIEANQTTMSHEISRTARATAELNQRCTERLRLKPICPLDEDDDEDLGPLEGPVQPPAARGNGGWRQADEATSNDLEYTCPKEWEK